MTNILVVDEERSIRQAIKFELESEGYIVIDVNNYTEAFSAFNAFKCSLVISDISDANGNGKKLLNTIKNVPFIALSAYPNKSHFSTVNSIPNDRYFEKPFPIKQLVTKVHEALNDEYIFADAV